MDKEEKEEKEKKDKLIRKCNAIMSKLDVDGLEVALLSLMKIGKLLKEE